MGWDGMRWVACSSCNNNPHDDGQEPGGEIRNEDFLQEMRREGPSNGDTCGKKDTLLCFVLSGKTNQIHNVITIVDRGGGGRGRMYALPPPHPPTKQ